MNEYTKYDDMTATEAIREMDAISKKIDAHKASLVNLNKEYDVLRLGVVPKKMEDAGIRGMTVEGAGRVTITDDIYASIPAQQKREAYQFLRDTGHGDLIQDNINPSTLKAFCKIAIKTGEELPQELFKVTPFTRASITKV